MTDDLDKLRAAMASATPAARRKAADIAMAMEAFDRSQGSASDARPTSGNHPTGWFWQGVRTMMNAMTTRGGIVATTALVAIGVVMVLPDRAAIGTLGTLSIDEAPVVRSEPAPELEGLSSADVAAVKAPPVAAIPAPEMAAPQAEARQQFRGATALSDVRERPAITRPGDIARPPEAGTEAFANMPPSALKTTIEDPVATFSVDVDTASYAVIRSSLTRGTMPPRDAVRIEEMVNYFPYAYPVPDGFHPFEPTVTVMPSPWNDGTRLVHIAVQGETAAIENRPPLNLVFLIDTSGSMQEAARLPLLKQSFAMMLSELRADDRVAIVTYAGSAGQVLEPTRASERGTILAALDQLEAGGSTAGQAGLQQAYSVAEAMADDGDVTRVILATDGDFNVGLSDPEALKDFIADKRDSGTYLSVLGFGRGNLDDATMQALAQNGNGTAAYIDTLSEARKVLVDQLTGALFPIADDVKLQVEFNPAAIAEYRLIGYETRALAREDFNNDRVDAGDIGAGHSVTAIFEVTPVGSDAVLTDALRYQAAPAASNSNEYGFLKLRYKRPGEAESTLIERPILPTSVQLSGEAGFAAAIAGFGSLLRGVDYVGDWTYADAIDLANATKGDDPFGYRTEAVTLMRLAESLDR